MCCILLYCVVAVVAAALREGQIVLPLSHPQSEGSNCTALPPSSDEIQGYKAYPDLAARYDDLSAVRGQTCDWTLDDCAGACNATSDCTAFVVDRQNDKNTYCCFLKTQKYSDRIVKMSMRESGGASYLKQQGAGKVFSGPKLPGYSSLVQSDGVPVDARWNDIRHYCYTNLPDCAKSCNVDSKCVGFSFRYDDIEDKGGKNCCYLKSKIGADVSTLPTFKSLGGLIGYTYRKQWQVVENYRVASGWDFSGNDLPSGAPLRDTNEAGCIKACNEQGSKCVGFVFGAAPWGGCPNCCYLKESFTGASIESSGQSVYVKLP